MRMSSPLKLVTQRGQKLERGFLVGMQRLLTLHPRLGMRERLEYAASSADGAVDETSVHQKQENDGSLMEGHRGPVAGVSQIVLQVQAGVATGFFKQSNTMLVVAVLAVMSEFSNPEAWQLTGKFCEHGLRYPLGPTKSNMCLQSRSHSLIGRSSYALGQVPRVGLNGSSGENSLSGQRGCRDLPRSSGAQARSAFSLTWGAAIDYGQWSDNRIWWTRSRS
jgi:hypothetical protein